RPGKLEPKPRLDPGVPLVTLIFPIAALAAGDVGEALDQLDPHQIFGVLVAQLTLDPQPDRRAVRYRQRLVVQLVGQNCLRMVGIFEIDALVVGAGAIVLHRIRAVEYDIPCGGFRLDDVEQRTKLRALPLADRAPTLDTIVPRY